MMSHSAMGMASATATAWRGGTGAQTVANKSSAQGEMWDTHHSSIALDALPAVASPTVDCWCGDVGREQGTGHGRLGPAPQLS